MARKLPHGRDATHVKHTRKKFNKDERLFIFKRDNYTCQLCKKDLADLPEERVLDHIVPLSQYGHNRFTNIWLLCDACDKQKKSQVLPCAINARIAELEAKAERRRRGRNNRP